MQVFFSSAILLSIFFLGESIYDLEIRLLVSGQPVNMYSFAHKKILIASISSNYPDTIQLRRLDSLQGADSSLVVIAIPLIEDNGTGNDRLVASLQKTMSLDFIITKSARVKKNEEANQHPLLRWLTRSTANGHFDIEIGDPGQMFIISRGGTLYGVVEKDVPLHVLNRILNMEEIQ